MILELEVSLHNIFASVRHWISLLQDALWNRRFILSEGIPIDGVTYREGLQVVPCEAAIRLHEHEMVCVHPLITMKGLVGEAQVRPEECAGWGMAWRSLLTAATPQSIATPPGCMIVLTGPREPKAALWPDPREPLLRRRLRY